MDQSPTPSAPDPMFSIADPFVLFQHWMAEAEAAEINDPNAMALATVDQGGIPNTRVVLLKGFDSAGFVFYTNTQSAKGVELAHAGQAALGFHWKSLRRQVRVRGPVTTVSAAEADEYFASRPRGSQIGAWASDQSRGLEDRAGLEERVARLTSEYEGRDVPRPPHWTGFRVTPLQIEFWRDMPYRLHDRRQFQRTGSDAPWADKRLYP